MNRILRATLIGLAGGGLATVVKGQAEGLLQPFAEKLLPPPAAKKAHQLGADPDGHLANMPPSELADQAQHAVTGKHLSDDEREQASTPLHWAMGLGFSVAYAVAADRYPVVSTGHGTLAGATLFATTHGSGLPLAGVQASPLDLPRAWWIWEGGSHLVFGATLGLAVEAVDRLLPA